VLKAQLPREAGNYRGQRKVPAVGDMSGSHVAGEGAMQTTPEMGSLGSAGDAGTPAEQLGLNPGTAGVAPRCTSVSPAAVNLKI